MKKLLMVAFAATLVSCAGTDTSTTPDGAMGLPPEAASIPGESDNGISNDPFLNSAEDTDPSKLATAPAESPTQAPLAPPSDAPSATMGSSETPPPIVADAPPVPVAPEELPKPLSEGQPAADANPSASSAEGPPASVGGNEPPPYATATTKDETTVLSDSSASSGEKGLPPPVVQAPGTERKSSYREEYKDYQARLEADSAGEQDANRRAEFAHEGGAWQVGLDYDFGSPTENLPTVGAGRISDSSTLGGALSWTYFPLRGIDTGRLGVGARAGAYLSKFDTANGSVQASSNRKLSAFTYGLRATYELQYWVAQLFVPFVFVGYDQVNVKGFSQATTSVSIAAQKYGSVNYGGGLSFNLNRLEPRAASKSLVSTGVRKFYLAYTFQQRSDSQNTGPSHYLGLRFEY